LSCVLLVRIFNEPFWFKSFVCCSDMANERERYKGSDADLASLLRPHIARTCFCSYGEAMDASPVQPELILPSKALISTLYTAQPNGSYRESQMTAALTIIANEKIGEGSDGWASLMEQQKRETWATKMSRRVRTMLRHCTAARTKNLRPPSWLKFLDTPDAMKIGGASAENKESDVAAKYVFGYNEEISKAFRTLRDKPGSRQEPCDDMYEDIDAKPSDYIVAKWLSDGVTWKVVDVTVDEWRKRSNGGKIIQEKKEKKIAKKKKKSMRPCCDLWSCWRGEQLVKVKRRSDRHPLISMYVDGKQWLQVPERRLSTQQQAIDICVEIAKAYVDKKLKKKVDLKIRREALIKKAMAGKVVTMAKESGKRQVDEKTKKGKLKEKGVAKANSSVVMKRPAAKPSKGASVDVPTTTTTKALRKRDKKKVNTEIPSEDGPCKKVTRKRFKIKTRMAQSAPMAAQDSKEKETADAIVKDVLEEDEAESSFYFGGDMSSDESPPPIERHSTVVDTPQNVI